MISQTAQLRLKKITDIREKADDFVHELNRMREEDKVCAGGKTGRSWLPGEGDGVCGLVCADQDGAAERSAGAGWQCEDLTGVCLRRKTTPARC